MLTEKEIEIIEGCQKGDKNCQKMLYDTYGPLIKGTCLRYAADTQEAEDLFHDIFIFILTHFDQYTHISSLDGWLHRITVNKLIDYLRHKKTIPTVSMSQFEQEPGVTVDRMYDGIPMEVLLGYIQKLPDKMRTAFNLYIIDDLPQAQIAEMMHETQNNVSTMISRARATLRKSIQKFWRNEENNYR